MVLPVSPLTGSAATAPNSLQSLPWDVLFDVLCRLSVPDVIALRLTCRMLFDVSKSRSLWLRYYRAYVEDQGIIPAHMLRNFEAQQHSPSSPFPYPGDAFHLERVVTASGRTAHALLKNSSLPAPSRIMAGAFSGPSSFAKLLPGGRFLVTGASVSPDDTLASSVFLWDLSKETNLAVSTVPFEMPVLQCNFTIPKDRDVIRLIVSTGHRFFGFEAHIIDVILPESPNDSPKLVKIATLPDVPVAPIRLAVDDDVAFFTTPSPVILWNWKTDAMAAGIITDHSRALGLVQRYPHVMRSDTRNGRLSPYILPQPSERLPSGDPDVSRVFHVFPIRSTEETTPSKTAHGEPGIFDAAPIQGWRPTSVTKTAQMVTATSMTTLPVDEDGIPLTPTKESLLRIYDWTPPANIPFPNDEAEAEKNGVRLEMPGPPIPGELTPLAKCTIPSVEQLRDVVVQPLGTIHRSHTFLAVAPPEFENDNRMAVRVMSKDGEVLQNSIGMWEGMSEKWHLTDSMMVDPQSGRMVAVTTSSIMVFDL